MTRGHRLTVTFVVGKDPGTELGGHSTYVRAHARAATAAGFSVRLVGAGPADGCRETPYGRVWTVRSPWRPFSHLWLPMHGQRLLAHLTARLGAEPGPHLVHAFGHWGWVAVQAARRLARCGRSAVPIVSAYDTVRQEARGKLRGVSREARRPGGLRRRVEAVWYATFVRRLEREAWRSLRVILVNYETVRRQLELENGGPLPIRRLPYAPETAFLEPDRDARPGSRTGTREPLVVAVSRHDHRKGLDVLLRALARLRDEGVGVRACLVGGGFLLEAHRAYAARLGLSDRVLLTGWVPDALGYLRAADVYVLPSVEEGSGSLALLEALAAGVPVVASAIDGIPEDVAHGVSALLVPPGDPGALAVALRRVLSDPALRATLARSGREVFETRFSAQGLVRALADTYAELGFAAADGGRLTAPEPVVATGAGP